MNPDSSGRAGIAALVLAGLVLSGAAWLALGTKAPEGGNAAAGDRSGEAALRKAQALSNAMEKTEAPGVPDGTVFRRVPAAVIPAGGTGQTGPAAQTPPGTAGLEGVVEKDRILLTWRATGDQPPTGWLVERLDADGAVADEWRLPPAATEFRDGSLSAVAGERIYRVTALAADGRTGGAEQRVVRYRLEVSLAYLGRDPEGAGRFRVALEGRPPAEFTAGLGVEIGDAQDEMDWRTGWRFVGLRGTRQDVQIKTDVPRFAADGRLLRDDGTGDIIVDERVMPVPQVTEGAVVVSPETPDVERWLPRSED